MSLWLCELCVWASLRNCCLRYFVCNAVCWICCALILRITWHWLLCLSEKNERNKWKRRKRKNGKKKEREKGKKITLYYWICLRHRGQHEQTAESSADELISVVESAFGNGKITVAFPACFRLLNPYVFITVIFILNAYSTSAGA